MAATESDIAAKLIERLLADPAFRDRFRRNPAAACREAGLDSLADEMAIGAGKAMHTLDMRESRSSLAGVVMAAAMEGMGLYEFSRHVVPQIEDLSGSIGDVLSRVNLPALPGGGSLAGAPPPSAAPPPATDVAADGNGGGAGAAAAAAAPAAPAAPANGAPAAPVAPELAGKGGGGAGKDAAAPPELAGKREAEKGGGGGGGGGRAKEDDGGGSELPGGPASGVADAPAGASRGDPVGSALPTEQVEPKAAKGGELPGGKAAAQPPAAAQPAAAPAAAQPAAPAAPAAPETAAAAPPPEPQAPAAAPPVEPQAPERRAPIDPDQFGQEGTGTGGKPDAEARAILENKNITFDSVGVADIKAGRIDPRIVAVLTKLSQEHKIVVSCMCSDHPRMTTSGFVSNHTYGRGLDIASIDGEIVSPGSALAREVASELSEFPASIRGDEIGSPFAISGPGYFTDAAHQNHIHVGFKTEITPDWEPPPGLRADAPAAAPAAAPAVAAPAVAGVAPAAGVAAAPAAAPPAATDPERGSGLFGAIGQPAEAKVASAGGSDSGLFAALDPKAAQPAQVAATPAPPADAAAAPADAGAPAAVDVSAVSDAYPGDDASKAQLAAWMGKLAEKRGLPPQLPVMASLVESGLKNLNFGDADSVGFFQMRLSYWNQGDYAGYPDDPKKQIDWFLDQAEQIKNQRESRGQSVTDPNQFGEWIADVERPAEQYRGRYQLQLDQANSLLKAAPPPAAPEVAATPAPAPAAPAAPPVEPQAPERRAPIDADQFGQEGTGTGGKPDAEALAILKNKNVTFDDVGISDIKAGRIDPRIVAVLTKLSQEHKIVVSCMCSDHPRMTTSGFVSNHTYGRGLDIASIDGEIVSPGSALAREVASELSQFDSSIRPDEIGSPFAISGPGYFTDAAHQNHVHVGFKTEIAPDWTPPAGLRADAPAAAPAVAAPAVAGAPAAGVAAVPGAPAAPAAPTDPSHGSGLFEAIARPEPAKTAAAGDAGGGGSGLFAALDPKAQPPAQPAQVAAQPAPGAAPAADVAAGAVDVSAVSDAYPGDDASKAQLAAWMGKLAEKRGLPPQLPVMASLVESGLKNLNFGDADSVGFFQMRLSYWNQGDYAGYPDDPKKQIDWFLDQAEQIKNQRESRGQSVTDPNQFGEWIADVERPAEQYRGRYQLQLDQANSLLKAAPPPAAPEAAAAAPAPAAQAVAEAAAPPAMAQGPGAKAEAALTEAKKFLGTPYKWGGSTPQTGFDCSGLVQWAYAQQGIQIPRVTDQQILATNGTAVKRSELLAGDLVFFRDSTGYVHHVGMSLGGDKFIHAPHTGDVVKISSLDEPYYKEQFTGGRRFDKAASAAPAAPAAPVAPVQPAAPAVDPVAVAQAQAAVARDAAEAGRQGSGLFKAISVQEARNHEEARALASDGSAPRRSDSALFLQAITPERAAEAKAAAQAAPVPPPAPEAAAPAPGAAAPAAPEVAAAAPAGSGPDLADVPAGYPGDDAGQAALAKWLAKHAEKAGLPPELPVMASLVESGVRNLDYGDADSVGFFQMRTSIWDQGEYAGYGKNPGLQAKWFIDHALAVKKQAIARGDAGFGKDPSGWGEWIADIERPAEQYRGRYQLRLDEARRLLR